MKIMEELSKISSIDMIDLHQSHLWNQWNHKLKEPTNEELEMTANIAISYGAKGIMYFAYNGVCEGNGYNTTYEPSGNPPAYSAGFVDKNKNIRDINAYGQNKWNLYKRYNRLLEKWGPTIMKFDNNLSKSFIYRDTSERKILKNDYHYDLFSYKQKINQYNVPEDNVEPENSRYIQMSLFSENEQAYPFINAKYFMITNRRCSPYIDNETSDKIGGKRNIKLRLRSSGLWFNRFRNVSLINIENDSVTKVFYNNPNYVVTYDTLDLGWFNPGEAKIFKMLPTMMAGGTLVAGEDFGFYNFICDGKVKNGGNDIYIADSTTINFTAKGSIEMNGGNLLCAADNYFITLKGKDNVNWNGLSLTNCDFLMKNTKIENTSSIAVSATNCNYTDFNNCIFNVNSNGIRVSYFGNTNVCNAYITNCKFNISNPSTFSCDLKGNASGQINVFMNGNEFSGNNNIAAVIIKSGIGTIKNNKIIK